MCQIGPYVLNIEVLASGLYLQVQLEETLYMRGSMQLYPVHYLFKTIAVR